MLQVKFLLKVKKTSEPKVKTRHDWKCVSRFMFIFNIITATVAIVLFCNFIILTIYRGKQLTLSSSNGIAVEMTRQIDQYLELQEFAIEDIVFYIESADLTKEEAYLYLKYISALDGNLALVDMQAYQGDVIVRDLHGKNNIKRIHFSQNEELRQMCEQCRQTPNMEKVVLSDFFENPINGENAIAFYKTVSLQDEEVMLLYILNTSKVIDYIGKNTNIVDRGILIDKQGNIISGDTQRFGMQPEPENPVLEAGVTVQENEVPEEESIETFLNHLRAEDTSFTIEKEIDAGNCGAFLVKDKSKNRHENIYVYLKLENFKDCYYLTRISQEFFVDTRVIIAIICGTICFIAFPWIFNASVMFWQNRRLRRTLIELEENNEELENANKAQTTFISSMSHEIRTPINAVLGMDEMIIRESTDDVIKNYAYDIKNAGKSLLGIVNDILDFTKIEAGKMDIIEEEYSLSSMINDLVNMTKVRLQNKELEFLIDVNPDIPHLLYGDEIRIKQIILNLLTNAVKYTQEGSVQFKVDYARVDEDNIDLFVSVKDTGIGMKPEEMEKLFVPFERLDEKKNRTIEGTGLGMSIVTGLLSQMGSTIEVESEYGVGSTFSFHLRQKVLNWKCIGPFTEQTKIELHQNEDNGPVFIAYKARILVVDDTIVNLTVVKGLLKHNRMQIDTATSGRECLAMLQKQAYHMVLLDHRMPEMDGIETIHRIRQLENENRDITVIALTANAVSGAKEYYLQEGFQDYLTKPVNGKKMEHMLLKYLPEDVIDTEEDLAVMVDEETGIQNCGTKEIYLQTVTDVTQNAEKISSEIQELLSKEDIENYTIKVHALKSTARLLGALKLSEEAAFLEACGDKEDKETIKEKTPVLLKHFGTVTDNLKKRYQIEADEQDKPLIEQKELSEALRAMQEFNAAFDFDQVDNILNTLTQYQVPSNAGKMLEQLKSAVYDINQQEIEQLITSYLQGKVES